MRNIIIEYNIRDLEGNPTGETLLIFDNKEGYMDENDFFNITEGNGINEPSISEFEGVCPKTKKDVIYNRALIITNKTDEQLINEYRENNNGQYE